MTNLAITPTLDDVHALAEPYRGLDLATLCERIKEWRERKGFVTDASNIEEKLMLTVTELAEAMEEYRDGQLLTYFKVGPAKPYGLASELADVIIRILDIISALNINIIGLPGVHDAHERPAARIDSVNVPHMLFTITRTLASCADRPQYRHYVFALAFIQTCELGAMVGANMREEIALKMGFNETRPHKHGRTC